MKVKNILLKMEILHISDLMCSLKNVVQIYVQHFFRFMDSRMIFKANNCFIYFNIDLK